MTRTLRILYIGLFLSLLLGLGGWSLGSFKSFSTAADTSLLNGKWSKAAETHYDEKFPIKRLGTNLWAALDYKVFNEGRPGVVLGREQWLFSDEEFKPVANSAKHLEENWQLIEGVRNQLARQGVQLVLAIIPAKARLYPEFIAGSPPVALQQQLYLQFHQGATDAGIFAPDLLAALTEEKQRAPVFLRTDTHWTPHGAEVVAQQLSQAIQQHSPLTGATQRFSTENQPSEAYSGDLTRFLPLDPLFSHLLPAPDQLQPRSTEAAQTTTGAGELFGDSQVPVVLVGTSYSANPRWNFLGALRQALGRDVLNFAEDGHGPLLPMLKYLQSTALKDSPPQLVIWEFPERYLPMGSDLNDFDPQWLSQLKSSRAAEQSLASANPKTHTPIQATP